MPRRKTMIRFFTIADFEEEERFLREQHQSGWKLVKTVLPCFFIFEACTPEDVVYRLDYKNGKADRAYFQIFADYGWEYCNRCTGWLYFRKKASATDGAQDDEIFSDDASRVSMLDHIIKTRMLPLVIVFFAVLIPDFINLFGKNDPALWALFAFYVALLALYVFLFIHCGTKLRKLKKRYGRA